MPLPPRSFYMLRHGESEANAMGVGAGGGIDSPLTALGLAQADDVGRVFHTLEIKPTVIYHSPMQRAANTAKRVNTINLNMVPHHDFVEHRLGAWEGMPWEELRRKLDANETPENGESMDVFSQRVLNAMQWMFDHAEPHDIPLIVSHGGVFKAFGHIYGHDMRAVKNCVLYRIDPWVENTRFPWKIWEYISDGEKLTPTQSHYCPSLRSE